MRGVGLTLLTGVLGCVAPPGVASELDDVHEPPREPLDQSPADLAIPDTVVSVDAGLAQARANVRTGRVSDATRSQLLGSTDPDHRHAARLLQAIAGEPPAEVLGRAGQPGQLAVAVEPELEPVPELAPVPEPEPEPELQAEPEPEPDQPVVLGSLVPQSPAWWWFASGLVTVESADPIAVADEFDPAVLFDPLPLLLRERPPVGPARGPRPGDRPQLVILTSLSLRSGPEPDLAVLELAGAGSVSVAAQPLTGGRVRLWMLDAGAVPSFLAARPVVAGLEVVDVIRDGRRLEIEIELGPGWTLRGATKLDNGASVQFERMLESG